MPRRETATATAETAPSEAPEAAKADAPAVAFADAGTTTRASAVTEGGTRGASASARAYEKSGPEGQSEEDADDEPARGSKSNTPAVASARFDGDPDLEAIEQGSKTVKEGDQGLAVTKLQQALHDLRYLSRNRVDGDFGSKTRKALKEFQKDADVSASGELDQATLAALQSRFDQRKVYVKAGKLDKDDDRTRALDDQEKQAALEAMVTPGQGSKHAFVETINGEKYGDRISARLATVIPAKHKAYYADRAALRTDPDNLNDKEDLEGPAAAAKKVTDKVYGSYAGKNTPALSFGTGTLVDLWEENAANAAASSPDEKRDWALGGLEYLVITECPDINVEHHASPGRAEERAILDGIFKILTGFPTVVDMLVEIDVGWPGMQWGGTVGIQRFKHGDNDADRAEMWSLFHTCIHEYIHLLKHEKYEQAAAAFDADGDSARYHTMIEGFADFFTLNVRAGLSIDKRLQRQVEGTHFRRRKEPPEIDAGLYPSHAEAERVVSIVGIKNALAAYFLGDVDKVGVE